MGLISKIIVIEEPFYSAGKIYGWNDPPIGIGINQKFFKQFEKIRVRVIPNKKIWEISRDEACDFVKQYKSFHFVKGEVLWVIPWAKFSEGKQ